MRALRSLRRILPLLSGPVRRPDDAPVWKADQIRRIFKRHLDWTGRVVPWWVKADTPRSDEDLNRLKDIVFGTCSACRRCTYNCPMGVDTALLVRFARGLLTELGILPEGVFNVSRDQWETGNQMAVTEQDYLETLEWMRDEVRAELGNDAVDPARNPDAVTFHDSCNIARSGDLVEEPRWVLGRVCADFREMSPNRRENFCCTGAGGLLSMAEYRPLRLEVAKIKAEQLSATGAKLVCTMCHNCVDGLTDVIKHYKLPMKVVQIMELVSNALILP